MVWRVPEERSGELVFGMIEALLSFIRRQVGLRTDAASASGSLHAKTTRIFNEAVAIKNSVNSGVLSRQCVPSDSQKFIDTRERSHSDTSVVKKYEIQIMVSGGVRVSFDMRTGAKDYIAYGQIYINGVPVGVERSTSSQSYTTFTEDIMVSAGDRLQLWVKASSSNVMIYFKDFKVLFDVVEPGLGQVLL